MPSHRRTARTAQSKTANAQRMIARKRTAQCPECARVAHCLWVAGICRRCYDRARNRAKNIAQSRTCISCGRRRQQLTADGYCADCDSQTEEALEELIQAQLKSAPLWFWRDVWLRGLSYPIPPEILEKFRADPPDRTKAYLERIGAQAGEG